MASAGLLVHDSEDDSDSGHEHPATAAARAGSGARMRELLASYYGMQQQERSDADMSTDVESTYFDAKRYVAGLLKNDKVETLLRKDDDMVREVKKLDSDMQMLVYENYNKFISATDTIRKMAQNVEGMETEMTDLKSSMERIAGSSAKVNSSLEGNRSKMDKLVRVRRLLQRLDFLFQLPQKLEEAVQEGQYSKAIRYFSMTKDILRKHSHVSSFGAIQRDCEDTVRRLQERLQDEVNSSDVGRDTLVSHVDILLQLGVDPAGLKERYLEAHRRQLEAFLSASKRALVEDRSVSLDACLGKLPEGFLPMLLRTVQLYHQLFQQSAATPPQGTTSSTSPTRSSLSTEQSRSRSQSQSQSQSQRRHDQRDNGNGNGNDTLNLVASGQGAQDKTREGLISLVQAAVDSFFDLLYVKVAQSVDVSHSGKAQPRSPSPSPSTSTSTSEAGRGEGSLTSTTKGEVGGDQKQRSRQQQQGGGGDSTEAAGGGGLDPVALGGVVAAVQQLVSDIETVDPHVPQVQLARRATEFAQEFKKVQVRRSFRVLCRTSLSVATSMVCAVRAGTPPQDILADAVDNGYPGATGGGLTGGSSSRYGTSSFSVPGGGGGGGRNRRFFEGAREEEQQYPALVQRALGTLIKRADQIVSGLRPLSRLDSSPAPLAEELRFGLWGVVLWLSSALGIVAGVTGEASSCETLPSAEGREYSKALEEEWGRGAVAALGEPLPLPFPLPGTNKAAAAAATVTAMDTAEGGGGDGNGNGKGVGATEGEVVLLLACLCRGLGTAFVVSVPEILGRQIPLTLDQSVHAPASSMHFSGSMHSTRSVASTLKSGVTERSHDGDEDSAAAGKGGGGPVLGRRRQLDAVRDRVSSASLFILEHYAETTGRRVADVLQVGLDAPPGGVSDWFSVGEPTAVGEAVLNALELAEDNVKEVCAFLGEARSGTVSVTRSGDRDLRRGSSILLSGRNGRSGMGGPGGVRRDIDRIFESSAAGGDMSSRGYFGGAAKVSFASDAMLAAVFRVALTAFGERARFLTLPGPAFRQVYLDADFLRQVLPFYVSESKMLSSLDKLLDQALQSAADRSLDPTPMDPAAAGEIVAQALDGFN